MRVRRLLDDAIGQQTENIVILDNIELLFDPALHQDPLACLKALSRNKTLIASWGGAYLDDVLTYAEPGHPEYRRYENPDVVIFALP